MPRRLGQQGRLTRHTKKGSRGLQKVFDILAFFSPVHGNLSSDIYYYASGVTAAFAASMTPMVLVAAGILFSLPAGYSVTPPLATASRSYRPLQEPQ